MLWLAIEVQTFLSLVADERGMQGFAFMWRRHDKQVHRVVLKSPLDNEAKADQEYVSTHSGKAQFDAKLEKLNIFRLHNLFKIYIYIF